MFGDLRDQAADPNLTDTGTSKAYRNTGDKVYIASADGEVVALAAGDELKVLARNRLDSAIMATPAVVDGKIYVRTEGHLYAFGK